MWHCCVYFYFVQITTKLWYNLHVVQQRQFDLRASLTLGACTQGIIIVICLCVCVYVPSLPAALYFFNSKLNMAISFSEGFKGLQLTNLSEVVYFKRCYFVPTFGVQVSHFVHIMAIIAVLAWCMSALQGEEFHVIGHAC